MRRSQSVSLLRFGEKTGIMLVVVLVFPLYVTYSGGGWQVFSMSFVVYSPTYYVLQIIDEATAFMFVPPQLIVLGLAECLPGIYFLYRLSSQDISKRIGRSLLLATGTTLIMGIALPSTYPGWTYPWYIYYGQILYSFPVLALTTFVFIPAFGHECSLMMTNPAPRREKQGASPLRTLVASKRTARTIGLVVILAAVVLPYSFGILTYSYYSATVCVGLLFMASLMSYHGTIDPIQSFGYMVYPFPLMVIMLVPSLLRLVFAKRLLSYCRGIGSGRRLLVLGLIAEAWAFVASSPMLGILVYGRDLPAIPLPVLFLAGLTIVRRRDSFTQRARVDEQEVWPLSFEEEGPIGPGPTVRPVQELVKVPVAYVLVSRVRNRKRRTTDST